jgi:hypothetical protein
MTIEESLPTSEEVREEFRRTSRRLNMLLQLLGVCEKAEEARRANRSASSQKRLDKALAANAGQGKEVTT